MYIFHFCLFLSNLTFSSVAAQSSLRPFLPCKAMAARADGKHRGRAAICSKLVRKPSAIAVQLGIPRNFTAYCLPYGSSWLPSAWHVKKAI